MTVAVTSSVVAVAYLIHSYYRGLGEKVGRGPFRRRASGRS